jgi:hypothetical protein
VPVGALTGQTITFTATIAAKGPGSGTPTGSVVFTIDGVQKTVALVGGKATLITSFATAGNHNVFVNYAGDGHFKGSNNSTPPLSPFTQVVNVPVLAKLSVALVGNVLQVTALDALDRVLTSRNGMQSLTITQVLGPGQTTLPGVVNGLPAGLADWVNGVARITIHVANRGTYYLHFVADNVTLVPDFKFNVSTHI